MNGDYVHNEIQVRISALQIKCVSSSSSWKVLVLLLRIFIIKRLSFLRNSNFCQMFQHKCSVSQHLQKFILTQNIWNCIKICLSDRDSIFCIKQKKPKDFICKRYVWINFTSSWQICICVHDKQIICIVDRWRLQEDNGPRLQFYHTICNVCKTDIYTPHSYVTCFVKHIDKFCYNFNFP